MRREGASPEEWMRFARSDLAVARQEGGSLVLPETLCFLAQQAAEKALKAVLRGYGIIFPTTHSLRALLELLPADLPVPRDIDDAAALSDYAVAARYPEGQEPSARTSTRRPCG